MTRALPLVLGLLGATAYAETPWGFTQGHGPLDLGVTETPDPHGCVMCHRAEHAAWSASRHRTAWSNRLMQAAYVVEQQPFCVHCHAPLVEQAREIFANDAWYRAQDPRDHAPTAPARHPEPRAGDGVDCIACHWRDGAILTPHAVTDAPHPVRHTPELLEADFCAGCHDFQVPGFVDGHFGPTDVPMQSTTAEWRDWRDQGGEQTCVHCHMPDGAHTWRGAHDTEWLRASLEVEVVPHARGRRFAVRSVGVGHHLPTGDIFRQITLEVQRGDAWEELLRLGRRLEHTVDPATGDTRMALVTDTALRPGQDATVDVRGRSPVRWRLRYHLTTEGDVRRGLLDPSEIAVVLHEGLD